MLHLETNAFWISDRHIATPIWRFHTGLCKFMRNILTNTKSLGKRTDFKLEKVPSCFISYNITISWLYPLNGFRVIFLLRDSENDVCNLIYCNIKKKKMVNKIKNGAFRKQWLQETHVISLPEFSSYTNPKWLVIVAFANFPSAVWVGACGIWV